MNRLTALTVVINTFTALFICFTNESSLIVILMSIYLKLIAVKPVRSARFREWSRTFSYRTSRVPLNSFIFVTMLYDKMNLKKSVLPQNLQTTASSGYRVLFSADWDADMERHNIPNITETNL